MFGKVTDHRISPEFGFDPRATKTLLTIANFVTLSQEAITTEQQSCNIISLLSLFLHWGFGF